MRVAITGANGFVGRHMTDILRLAGNTTEQNEIREISTRGEIRSADLQGCDAVVNLAGEPISQRWTAAAKDRIRSSRVNGTRKIVDAIAALPNPPRVLVNASAVGIYSSSGFLKEVVEAWEHEANRALQFGVRVVLPRFSVVLGRDGGALKQLLTPFKSGAGGRIGDGKQWMSWVHVRDIARLIEFAIRSDSLNGALDATAPHPVTNAEFTRELAHAVHRPAIFPVPLFALNLAFGEMARIIYESIRVTPDAALQAGFKFDFPELRPALEDIVASPQR